ncbi:alpha/beta hydrolase [Tumebacillus permanentifrigoris]|uniref:Acetyl esterase n=1 Tax=Tumebacillus permanentifrigoris TaxID=378543 RepID=A0A316DDY8_9BACL|nr:alpha/beta hydrolase [Tumebacillus permanentifrigoris]PWK16447.1 acetyl esterase [Tumebacillus permanentifrigoris]
MTLDPQVRTLLDLLAKSKLPEMETLRPPAARKALTTRFLRARQAVGKLVPPEPVHRVEDRTIPVPDGEIQIRIYTPEGDGPHPALVFLHGGGFVLGGLESHDDICRALTNLTPCVVIAVNYRLAPEHKFPTGLHDAYAATRWVFNNAHDLSLDPTRIAIGGDSAGGNLATVITHLAHDSGDFRPCLQLLAYPSTLMSRDNESSQQYATGYYLTQGQLRYFGEHYTHTPEEFTNPLVSPYLRADLTGLPPAFLLTAECDPLRDEAEAYAQRLEQAGVPVTLTRYEGMIHGFLGMSAFLEKAYVALSDCAAALNSAFAK